MNDTETGVSDDRIAPLEQRINALENLVKGMIQEMLDCKALVMTYSRNAKEPARRVVVEEQKEQQVSPAEPEPAPAPMEQKTVIRPKSAQQPKAPAVPAEPAMVRIMQSDGTWKMEPRRGEAGTIDTSPRPGGSHIVVTPKNSSKVITASDNKKKGQK
ncbi:MAG: hypothetical protein WC342_02325 [Methanoregula sp.]|jgi:uncharacterized membrane protein